MKDLKDEDDDDNKRNWLDSKVEMLIALKGEMQPEFIKNAKKQGMDIMSFTYLYINSIISEKILRYMCVKMLDIGSI